MLETVGKPAEDLQKALEYLRDASSQNNQKGKLVLDWFDEYLSEPVAISYIKSGNQIGNRLKEQKGKNAPNTVFLFNDDKLLQRTADRIHEYIDSGHSRIYFFTQDSCLTNGFALKLKLISGDSDPLEELIGDIFGQPDVKELLIPQDELGSISPGASEENSNIKEYFEVEPNDHGKLPLSQPLQKILHGCPGSGKSYVLAEDAKDAHFVIRTVFHPETRYSDFVGGLRPESIYRLPQNTDDTPKFEGATTRVPGEPYVQYVVQPGPLLKAYHLACLRPDMSVVLIVEELSRAVAAHVFGDMIQLLDRQEKEGDEAFGFSEYEIEPRPEIRSWLTFNQILHDKVAPGNMRFPPNLYIWATMNRSDQNARQLDSAFLRRWSKQYLSFREKGAFDDTKVNYGGGVVSWGELRSAINSKLQETEGVPEDKFIGPYFISKRRLIDPDSIYEDLLGYIWNDVLKSRASTFFGGPATFAELKEVWDSGKGSPLGPIESNDVASDE